MEEAVLLPVQDERQCRNGRSGPLHMSCVCQEGIASCASECFNLNCLVFVFKKKVCSKRRLIVLGSKSSGSVLLN